MLNQEMLTQGLSEFVANPTPGRYLVFTEFRCGHSGGTGLVPDLFECFEEDELDKWTFNGRTTMLVHGGSPSALFDSLATITVVDGTAWLSGDGVVARNWRITGMVRTDVKPTLEDSDELTDATGFPVHWRNPLFNQEEVEPVQGANVVRYGYQEYFGRPFHTRYAVAKDVAEFEALKAAAIEEVKKPKYRTVDTMVEAGGQVIYSGTTESVMGTEEGEE